MSDLKRNAKHSKCMDKISFSSIKFSLKFESYNPKNLKGVNFIFLLSIKRISCEDDINMRIEIDTLLIFEVFNFGMQNRT